jgi:hypothetical protein
MEPERPRVDRSILEFVKAHKFHPADFTIRADGVCRLNPVMAKCVAQVVCKNDVTAPTPDIRHAGGADIRRAPVTCGCQPNMLKKSRSGAVAGKGVLL